MSLSENTRHWFERLRTDVASIPDPVRSVTYGMLLAWTDYVHGLEDAARATLIRSMQRFDLLHPGTWTSLASSAAQLCGRLSESRLLEPEVRRGLAWLAKPEIVKYQTALPGCVHNMAIQVGWADVAADLITDEWPGAPANRLVDACRLASWAEDAAELRRLLPRAMAAITAAGPGQEGLRGPIGYWLVPACVRAGLLAEASELGEFFGFPVGTMDELVVALWSTTDRAAYARVRDGWLANRIARFRAKSSDHRSCSAAVRCCAETIRRLGDYDGYRNAVRQFGEIISAWTPSLDWTACAVHCNLAVLHSKAGEARISANYFSTARRLYDGKEPGVSSARGSRSLMASILSLAYRDVGDIEVAKRFARRISHAGDRRTHVVSALIVGGRVSDAEGELAKLDAPEERAGLIHYSLLCATDRRTPAQTEQTL